MTEFQLLDIWSKFHRKVIVLYSHITDTSCACSNKSSETEHSIHHAETSWKLKANPTACAVSHLAWENVTTVTRGGRVYSYQPRPPTSYTVCRQLVAVQWTRRLAQAQVGWQVMAQALKWPGRVGGNASLCMLPGWAKQKTNLWRHNRQAPNVMFPHTVPSASMPAWHMSVNQSSNTNIYSNVFGERIRQYSLCTDTTHHQLITCHACLLSIRSSVNNRLWNFKDRLRNNLSFKSLITPTNKTYLCTIWVNLAIIPKGYYGNNGYDVVGVVVLSECCDEIMQFVIV